MPRIKRKRYGGNKPVSPNPISSPIVANGSGITPRLNCQYKFFEIANWPETAEKELNKLAKAGWRVLPIILPSTLIINTLILEREVAPRVRPQKTKEISSVKPNKYTPERKARKK